MKTLIYLKDLEEEIDQDIHSEEILIERLRTNRNILNHVLSLQSSQQATCSGSSNNEVPLLPPCGRNPKSLSSFVDSVITAASVVPHSLPPANFDDPQAKLDHILSLAKKTREYKDTKGKHSQASTGVAGSSNASSSIGHRQERYVSSQVSHSTSSNSKQKTDSAPILPTDKKESTTKPSKNDIHNAVAAESGESVLFNPYVLNTKRNISEASRCRVLWKLIKSQYSYKLLSSQRLIMSKVGKDYFWTCEYGLRVAPLTRAIITAARTASLDICATQGQGLIETIHRLAQISETLLNRLRFFGKQIQDSGVNLPKRRWTSEEAGNVLYLWMKAVYINNALLLLKSGERQSCPYISHPISRKFQILGFICPKALYNATSKLAKFGSDEVSKHYSTSWKALNKKIVDSHYALLKLLINIQVEDNARVELLPIILAQLRSPKYSEEDWIDTLKVYRLLRQLLLGINNRGRMSSSVFIRK